MTRDQSQLDKFKEAARQLETDDDEARFDERVKKLVKHKPVVLPADPNDPEDFDVAEEGLKQGLAERRERLVKHEPVEDGE